MKIKKTIITIITIALTANIAMAKDQRIDMTETMKKSLVYLQTSFHSYEQFQPWRNKDVTENWSAGSAISKNEVITTAWNVANASFIQAKVYGQNGFIPAKIKHLDYHCNLAIIELDAEAMDLPLVPLKFSKDYSKGAETSFYWLSSGGHLYSGRGFLDRTEMNLSTVSYTKHLNFIVANASDRTGLGQIYCLGKKPIGIACWSTKTESAIISGEVINRFIAETKNKTYKGFGAIGFSTTSLLDPAMRSYLEMPDGLEHGVYVSDIHTIGTGSDVLRQGDVILAIDGKDLNPYGRFMHPKYDRLYFDYLITSKRAGEKISLDIWRKGATERIAAEVKNFEPDQMLVPYYELDTQPEYVIIGGFILQKLTKPYMAGRGEDWQGKTPSHILNYWRNMAFKPQNDRKSVIVLSYVLPADLNIGYSQLGQLVVNNINGMKISSMKDIPEALKLNPQAKYDVIEFELDNPKVVIDRSLRPQADLQISRNYGVGKMVNINE